MKGIDVIEAFQSNPETSKSCDKADVRFCDLKGHGTNKAILFIAPNVVAILCHTPLIQTETLPPLSWS
jgi:hypothetical protein